MVAVARCPLGVLTRETGHDSRQAGVGDIAGVDVAAVSLAPLVWAFGGGGGAEEWLWWRWG